VDGCGDVNRLVALGNDDLQRILDWSRDNSLILNASKTQALLVSRRIRPEDVGSDVILGGDSVRLFDVMKNLGQLCSFSHLCHFAFALSFSEIYVQGS
jgi:hypothetical protein